VYGFELLNAFEQLSADPGLTVVNQSSGETCQIELPV